MTFTKIADHSRNNIFLTNGCLLLYTFTLEFPSTNFKSYFIVT